MFFFLIGALWEGAVGWLGGWGVSKTVYVADAFATNRGFAWHGMAFMGRDGWWEDTTIFCLVCAFIWRYCVT